MIYFIKWTTNLHHIDLHPKSWTLKEMQIIYRIFYFYIFMLFYDIRLFYSFYSLVTYYVYIYIVILFTYFHRSMYRYLYTYLFNNIYALYRYLINKSRQFITL